MSVADLYDRSPTRLALAGIVLMVVAVALAEGRVTLGPVPLDAITLTVPLALLACLPVVRQRARDAVHDSGVLLPALVFLGFALVSVVADALSLEAFLTYARYLFYLLLAGAVAVIAKDASARRIIMWAIAITGSATVVHGLWWYATSLLEVRRAAAAGAGAVPAIELRIVSTFQNANFYAEFLVLLIAVLGYLALTEHRLPRMLAVAFGMAAAVALLLTFTRGSWFGLIVATALVVLAIAPRRAWVVVVVPLLVAVASPTVQERLVELVTLEGSAGFRMRLWRIAGAVIASAPLTGTGIGTFYEAFTEAVRRDPALSVGFEYFGAHNSYFTLLAETGVFGGAAFILLIAAILRVAIRPLLDGGVPITMRMQIGALAVGLGAFALNALTSNAFQHPQPTVFFWLLTGVLVAVAAEVSGAPRPEVAATSAAGGGRFARVVAASHAGRAVAWFGKATSAFWRESLTRGVLMRPPTRCSAWVLSSWVGRLVLGGRPQ